MKRAKKLAWILLSTGAALGLVIFLVFQMPAFGGSFSGARLERMKNSPEFIQGRFENTPVQNTDNSLIKNFKLYQESPIRDPQVQIPVEKLEAAALRTEPRPGLRTRWFGHASVLSEIDGVRLMTDPVLSERVSPLTIIGPRRFHPSPIPLAELSGIDFVVISHDHYDHLDMETTKHLAKQGTHFFVGLGVGAHLDRWSVPAAQIHEMDWWEETTFKSVRIVCAPARHYSGRKRMDNSTLWTSWLIKGPAHSVYFSGDTGYAEHFSQIKSKYGAVDMTLMKVGAYGETWLDIHMDPESAVQAHLDLGAKVMLPVHWGTFDLAYHSWSEPIVRTLAAAKEKRANVITPRVGELFEFGKPFVSEAWYGGGP